jgi:ribosomal protein L37E
MTDYDEQSDEELFATPKEVAEKVDLQKIIVREEILSLFECPQVLLNKIAIPPKDMNFFFIGNLAILIKELLERERRDKEIIAGITRCRKCGYDAFYMKEEIGKCPKCGVVHIRHLPEQEAKQLLKDVFTACPKRGIGHVKP